MIPTPKVEILDRWMSGTTGPSMRGNFKIDCGGTKFFGKGDFNLYVHPPGWGGDELSVDLCYVVTSMENNDVAFTVFRQYRMERGMDLGEFVGRKVEETFYQRIFNILL